VRFLLKLNTEEETGSITPHASVSDVVDRRLNFIFFSDSRTVQIHKTGTNSDVQNVK
jgi:hypothetical protein